MASLSSLASRPIAPRRARAARASASASRSAPRVAAAASVTPTPVTTSVLGCMTMGWRFASSECDDDVSAALMRAFVDAGHSELDTARAYAGGDTEKIMGRVLAADPDLAAKVSIATKANPWPGGNMTSSAGEGGLAPDELRAQVEASRAALAPARVDLLYLHAPDAATPIEATLDELVRLHDDGAFRRLGLSNFSAWETVRIHRLCRDAGLPAPDTYQGMYNCVTRAVEPELIPALRQLGMRFLAFNPLAGGLLTGKHAGRLSDPDGASATGRGRFTHNAMYQDRFWREEYFDAIDTIAAACEAAGGGLTPASAALRWLYSHSALDGAEGDGVILGASSVAHLEANLEAAAAAARGETLPEGVLAAIEEAWEVCKPATPPYARGHSKRTPPR